MEKYKTKIDKLLNEMITEYDSKHELTTKVMNYEYYQGKLYTLYELIEELEDTKTLVILYDYRRPERDEITTKFEKEYIQKVYNIVRKMEV